MFLPGLGFDRAIVNYITLFLMLSIGAFFYLNDKSKNNNYWIHLGFLIAFIGIIRTIFSDGGNNTFFQQEIIRFISYLILFLTYGSIFKKDIQINGGLRSSEAFKMLNVIYILLLLLGLFQYVFDQGVLWESGYGEEFVSSNLIAGFAFTPNAYAMLITIFLVFFIPRYKKSFSKNVILLVSVGLVVATAHRTSSIILGVLLGVYLYKKNKGLISLYILSILLILILVLKYDLFLVQKGFSSFTWRFSAWATIWQSMNISDVIFGYRDLSIFKILENNYVFSTNEPHNDYLRSIFYFGIGGLMFYILLIKFYINSSKKYNQLMILVIPVYLTMSLFENLYRDSTLIFLTAILIYQINHEIKIQCSLRGSQ